MGTPEPSIDGGALGGHRGAETLDVLARACGRVHHLLDHRVHGPHHQHLSEILARPVQLRKALQEALVVDLQGVAGRLYLAKHDVLAFVLLPPGQPLALVQARAGHLLELLQAVLVPVGQKGRATIVPVAIDMNYGQKASAMSFPDGLKNLEKYNRQNLRSLSNLIQKACEISMQGSF